MTAISCNGYPVLSGTITAPNLGAWYAWIETRAPLEAGDTVTLSDGENSLSGAVAIGGTGVSRIHARIIGGSDGLTSETAAKHWQNTTAGKVLKDICSAAGVSVSTAVKASVLSQSLNFWSKPICTPGQALTMLAVPLGLVWRVRPNGSIWLGEDTLTVEQEELQIMEPHPETDSYTVAPDSLSLWVGDSQNGGTVHRVEYEIESAGLRCEYWLT